ncbi:MAG: serine acetyltransferase [SAR324 cluster bacterium]|nr:serine acetyltransferase [SAR324 cluster bacterium]
MVREPICLPLCLKEGINFSGECVSNEIRFQKALADIIKSYQKHSEIAQIDEICLPAKDSIQRLADDIQVLFFPGLIRQECLDPLDLPYVIGQKTLSIHHRLKSYIRQVLLWEAVQRGEQAEESLIKERIETIAFEFIEYIPEIREILSDDVDAIFRGDPAAKNKKEIVIAYPGMMALSIHRTAHFFYNRNIPILPRIMSEYVHSQTGIDIHPGAKLGRGTMIDHGTGVVIGETSILGDHIRIYQGVTLGALSPDKKHAHYNQVKRHPTIEDNVVIYAGATILGGETVIGRDSVIGGNVWITRSVPSGSKIYMDTQWTTQKSVSFDN